jgi:hypothetical protein
MAVFEKAKLHAPNVEMEDKIFLYRFPEMDAKLDPDFKNSLYRKEAPVRKIIFTPNLMRASFAIAAMLILFIGLQLFKSESNVSESNIVESNIVESPLKDKTALAITNNASTNSKQIENTILPNVVNEAAISKKINNINIAIAKSATNQANFEDQTIATNNMNTNIVSRSEGFSKTNSENNSQSIVAAKFNEAQISSSSMETMATEEEKTILPTNYKEIDTEEEDRTINIGILEIDAAAFRGITRKFSALLKRNKIEK